MDRRRTFRPQTGRTQTGQLKQDTQFRQGKHRPAQTGDSTFPISQITIV